MTRVLDHLPTILVAMPAAWALLLLCFPGKALRSMYAASILVSCAGLGLSLLLLDGDYAQGRFQFVERADWVPAFGISYHVGVDGLSLFLVILLKFLMPIALLCSTGAVRDRVKGYLVCFFLLDCAMTGTFLALDLFLFFVFWELVLVPMYFIIGVWGSENRVYAAVKFFIFTMVGSAVMFAALLVLAVQYKRLAGSWSFDYFDLLRVGLTPPVQLALFSAFALSFAIKVPLWPLHTWLPDAHVEAPTAGSVMLAAVLLKMGTYGFLRFAMPLFPHGAHEAGPTIALLGLVGIVFGSLVAWKQQDLKKLVAYSSVAHLGLIMVGLTALTNRSLVGSVYQMLGHGVSTGALFLLVGVIYERRHTKRIDEFGGLARRMPAYAALFVVITLSSIALPGTNGFIGELLILWGTFTSQALVHPRWVTAVAATGAILGAIYMLGAVLQVFFGSLKNPKNKALGDLTAREWAYLLPLVAAAIFMGLYPSPFLKRIEPSMELLRMGYLSKASQSAAATAPFLAAPWTHLLDAPAAGATAPLKITPLPPPPAAPRGGIRLVPVAPPDEMLPAPSRAAPLPVSPLGGAPAPLTSPVLPPPQAAGEPGRGGTP